MFEKVSTDLNFAKREEEVVRFWREKNIFQKSIDLRKGGACLLELAAPPAARTARLLWLLEPRQARRIAR